MVSNKYPNKESTENLLDLLETNQVVDKVKRDPSVPTFIKALNIVPGTDQVRQTYLFTLYNKWIKSSITSNKFRMDLTKYFDYKDVKKVRFFLVDLKALNLGVKSKEAIFKQDKTKIRTYTTHFNNYLKYHDIKSGTYWVEGYVLYYLYDKWTYKNNNRNPLGEIQFANFCNLYFKQKQQSKNHAKYYGVEKTILNHVTTEHLQQIKKGYHDKKTSKRKTKEG